MLVHPHFDPVAISAGPFTIAGITLGPFAVRWYGLMYLTGFILFVLLGRRRARQSMLTGWHNFFFAFTVVAGMGLRWQVALGAVFLSGIAFLVMSIWGVRELLIHAIPDSLKRGIAVGIGLLITLVGLEWSGLVQSNPATYVALGDLKQPPVWMAGAGIVVTLILLVRRSRGAIGSSRT